MTDIEQLIDSINEKTVVELLPAIQLILKTNQEEVIFYDLVFLLMKYYPDKSDYKYLKLLSDHLIEHQFDHPIYDQMILELRYTYKDHQENELIAILYSHTLWWLIVNDGLYKEYIDDLEEILLLFRSEELLVEYIMAYDCCDQDSNMYIRKDKIKEIIQILKE